MSRYQDIKQSEDLDVSGQKEHLYACARLLPSVSKDVKLSLNLESYNDVRENFDHYISDDSPFVSSLDNVRLRKVAVRFQVNCGSYEATVSPSDLLSTFRSLFVGVIIKDDIRNSSNKNRDLSDLLEQFKVASRSEYRERKRVYVGYRRLS